MSSFVGDDIGKGQADEIVRAAERNIKHIRAQTARDECAILARAFARCRELEKHRSELER